MPLLNEKVKVGSLEVIAGKHGFRFEALADGYSKLRDYVFTKGDLVIRFNRRGWGTLIVTWRGFRCSSAPMRPGESGRELRPFMVTREEYAEACLSYFAEELVKAHIEASLKKRVSLLELELEKERGALASFQDAASTKGAA